MLNGAEAWRTRRRRSCRAGRRRFQIQIVADGFETRRIDEAREFQLAELLRRQDMAAEASFAALRAQLGGGEAVERLAEQLDRLDFVGAAATLAEVVELLGIESGGSAPIDRMPPRLRLI